MLPGPGTSGPRSPVSPPPPQDLPNIMGVNPTHTMEANLPYIMEANPS